MISITFQPNSLSSDEAIKMKAASKQLTDLLKRVSSDVVYRLLTPKDRDTLLSEGYAQDIINNLVFITQRIAAQNKQTLGDSQFKDIQVSGYNFAAFDPSIYATRKIKQHLNNLSNGNCYFCETNLSACAGGNVYHFRPPSILFEGSSSLRSPYYSLAYQQENLLYACCSCAEAYKGDHFPVIGNRFPECELANEKPLIVNPFFDEPRTHIRFNPLNGEAYAFDQICDYYRDTKNLSPDEIENLIWHNPRMIPNQLDSNNLTVSDKDNDIKYKSWQNCHCELQYKGSKTIETLGLNREELKRGRNLHLVLLHFEFNLNNEIKTPLQQSNFLRNDIALYQYKSLAIDAISTWMASSNTNSNQSTNQSTNQVMPKTSKPVNKKVKKLQVNQMEPEDTPPKKNLQDIATNKIDWNSTYSNLLVSHNCSDDICNNQIPTWLQSALIYVIFDAGK